MKDLIKFNYKGFEIEVEYDCEMTELDRGMRDIALDDDSSVIYVHNWNDTDAYFLLSAYPRVVEKYKPELIYELQYEFGSPLVDTGEQAVCINVMKWIGMVYPDKEELIRNIFNDKIVKSGEFRSILEREVINYWRNYEPDYEEDPRDY